MQLAARRCLEEAARRRWRAGDLFVAVHALLPLLRQPARLAVVLAANEEFYWYAGDDCREERALHLGLQRHVQLGRLRSRLQESLGVPTAELQEAIERVRKGEWTQQHVQEAVATLTSPDQRPAAIDGNPVLGYFESEGFRQRLYDAGAGYAAMPVRLRRIQRDQVAPSLSVGCNLCEAQFSSWSRFRWHQNLVHGGRQRYRSAWLELEHERPHVTSGYEKRRVIDNFHRSYRTATLPCESDDADTAPPAVEPGRQSMLQAVERALQEARAPQPATPGTVGDELHPALTNFDELLASTDYGLGPDPSGTGRCGRR